MKRPSLSRPSLSPLSLRRRLAALVALAVALGITLACTAAYLSSRTELVDQVDSTLRGQAQTLQSALPVAQVAPDVDASLQGLLSLVPALQLVGPSGQVGPVIEGDPTLPVAASDIAVADGRSAIAFRTVSVDGQSLRMVTVPYGTDEALQLTASLAPVSRSLQRLALVLSLVTIAGVLVAITAGLASAWAGLAPVGELTEAIERVARTNQLGPPLEVSERRRNHPDEVSRLATSFNGMLAALASSRQRQRQLVADASHELRTPLTSLRTNIELLARSDAAERPLPAEDRAKLLADLTAQTEELSSLIGELTALARDEDAAEEPVELDLAAVVTDAVERVRRRAGTVTLHTELSPTPLFGRRAMLERMVLNLLDNAVKWSPPGAEVYVGLRERQLLIADQGPGIAPEDLPHVFERFYRSTAARGRPGSGLGLAIVAEAAAEHSATVTLEPGVSGGTVARLRLPAH